MTKLSEELRALLENGNPKYSELADLLIGNADAILLALEDAERFRFCLIHGFPVKGPQWTMKVSGELFLGNSPNETIDAAMEGKG